MCRIEANLFLQVLRWSALGAGVFYGLYHQSKLSTSAKLAAIDREYQHKQSLIEKAKAEYAKKNMPASSKTEGGDGTFKPGTSCLYFLAGQVAREGKHKLALS